MSKNQFLEFLVYLSPALLGAVLLAIPMESGPDRSPQSILPRTIVEYPSENINYKKIEELMSHQVYDSAVMKVKGQLQVRMELVDEYEEGEPFRVRAFVTSRQPVEYADIIWTLGPGVEIVSGVQQDVIYNLNSEHPIEVEITAQKENDGLPARIFFNVKYESYGKVFAQTGYYSSQHQTTPDTGNKKKMLSNTPHMPGGLKVIY